jgi:hypothetical protein
MKLSPNTCSPTENENRTVSAVVVTIAAFGLLNLVVAVSGRFFFKWPLEWMEGAMLHGAIRLLQGLSIYGPPESEYIPFLYPPLSYLAMAASIAIFGKSYAAARLPSLLALAALLFFAARIAAYESKRPLAGAVTVGLIALGYGYGEAFFDLARLDMVFLVMVVAGSERLQRGRAKTALLLFVVSCLAKQHGFIFLFAATAWLAFRDIRRHLLRLAGAWIAVAAIYFVLHLMTGGWSTIYLFQLPRLHGVIWHLLPAYFLFDLLMLLPVLGIASFASVWRHRTNPRAIDAMLIAAWTASALGRAHRGGHDNVLIPGLIFMAIVSSATLVPILVSRNFRTTHRVLVAAVLLLQSLMLFQPPTLHWPRPESAAQFQRVVSALEQCAGNRDAVSLDFTLLTQTPFLHTLQLSDIRATRENRLGNRGTRALVKRLSGPDAPYAIAVGASFAELDRLLEHNYRICKRLVAPRMATGYQPQDMTIYQRKE